MRFFFKKSSE